MSATNHCCGRSAEECEANPTERCAGTFLKWVREAGAHHCTDEARAERQADAECNNPRHYDPADEIRRAVAAAVAAEREACEQRADAVFERWGRPEYGLLRGDVTAAIRARGSQ